MSSSYLEAARRVLLVRARPLSAQDILCDAVEFGILRGGLAGDTMHKTLQARITEDISENRHRSSFYRTGPGLYFLRELASDPTLSYTNVEEVEHSGRRRPPSTGRVLHLKRKHPTEKIAFLPISETLASLSESGVYEDIQRPSIDAVPVATFSVLRSGAKIFTHVVGKHSMFPKSVGRSSLGLGRYLDEYDRDLFSSDDFGVDMSAAREILRNIDYRTMAEGPNDIELRAKIRPLASILETENAVLWFVLVIDVGREVSSMPIRRRLDVNRPSWKEISELDADGLETVSSMLLKERSIK